MSATTTVSDDQPVARRRTARYAAIVVGVVVALLVVLLATREPSRNVVAPTPLAFKAAPEVVGEDLDGNVVRLSDFRGEYVVLNFFASWCVPCRNEHDDLEAFDTRHRSAGDARVVAVIFSDTREAAADFFERFGGDWPVLDDPKGQVALDFGVRGPPESFLIDPDGVVLTRIQGEVTAEGLERLLAEAKRVRG